MWTALVLALFAAIGGAACSKDSTTPTTPGPTTATQIYTLVLDTGMVDSAKATVATAVPVRVKLTKSGAVAPGAAVTWNVVSGHGTLSATSSTTNAAGIATVLWTLGDTAGINGITAASSDAALTFRALGTAGPVTALAKVTSDSSAVVTGASIPLTVRTTDKFGNGVSGAVVRWTATAGAFTTTSTTSGTSGNAQTVFTPATKGTYTVSATLTGGATVTFKVVAL
jgi:hypothetical protein